MYIHKSNVYYWQQYQRERTNESHWNVLPAYYNLSTSTKCADAMQHVNANELFQHHQSWGSKSIASSFNSQAIANLFKKKCIQDYSIIHEDVRFSSAYLISNRIMKGSFLHKNHILASTRTQCSRFCRCLRLVFFVGESMVVYLDECLKPCEHGVYMDEGCVIT
jgi:hypothetical protein